MSVAYSRYRERESKVQAMKGAGRFLFGVVLGIGLGYALMLLARPAAARTRPRPRPPFRRPRREVREREPVP